MNNVYRIAADWLANDPLFLDTETTGLDDDAQIVEIAILDAAGGVLFESLVNPGGPIPADAARIHGIGDAEVAVAPSWPQLIERVGGVLSGRLVVMHNGSFDDRMLRQTSDRHGATLPVYTSACTLALLTKANGGRWPRLTRAMELAGAVAPAPEAGRPHRAAYDAECCRRVVVALAANHQPINPRMQP